MLKGVFITERELLPVGQKIIAYSPEWEVEEKEEGKEKEERLSRIYVSLMERVLGEGWHTEGGKGLSWDEFQKKEGLEEVRDLVGSIYVPSGYQVSKIAPPPGKTWDDVKNAIERKEKVFLRLWVEKLTTPPAPLRKERYVESEVPTAFGLLAIDPSTNTVEYIPVTRLGEVVPTKEEAGGESFVVSYKFPRKRERGRVLSEEELEELEEKLGVFNVAAAYNELETLREELVALERRRQDLESQLEEETDKEKKKELGRQLREVKAGIGEIRERMAVLQDKIKEAEEEEEKREEEEKWTDYATTLMERQPSKKRLLKEILLGRVAEVTSRLLSQKKLQKASEFLWKAKKKDSDKRDDVEGAKRKLEEGLKALSGGDGLEALEDFATARFYLFGHDSYTEPLVNAFDGLMDIMWNAYKGRKYSKERARELVQRILRLIENPRGERAEPPRRVDSPRDARLWEMAKRIVKDEYRDVEEDSERFWQIVSRIFTRMKLRLGGAREEAVEKIVEELREKHGELPKGAKTAKEVERLKEKRLRSRGN
jgi:hypothetical protein